MRIAIFQMADQGDPAQNISKARRAIDGCDADCFVLPEFFAVPGGDFKRECSPEEAYQLTGRPAHAMLLEASRTFPGYLVGGTVVEKAADGYYNTCYVLKHGDVVAKYRKINLTDEEIAMGLLPGEQLVTFRTQWGNVGLLVCFDVCKEPTRDELSAQAELVLVPVGISVPDHPKTDGHPLCERLARRHNVTIAVVCRVGFYGGKPLLTSPSAVVSPSGLVWEASAEGEDFAVVDVALGPAT